MPVISALERQRQEEWEFEPCLGYSARPHLKTPQIGKKNHMPCNSNVRK
jgi:hypothetical protein